MKWFLWLVSPAVAVHASYAGQPTELNLRALPDAPHGYAPSEVECPTPVPSVRSAAKLSPSELNWLGLRRQKTFKAMKDFFGHIQIKDFDAVSYLDKISNNSSLVPNIGIAISGGGYRALMNGAGALKAFDGRTENATAKGQLGGLLQSATYLAGLSGGGWLLGSVYLNNFTTISSLQTNTLGTPWQFENSIIKGPDDGGPLLTSATRYYEEIVHAVAEKNDAGYPTTITDFWGRALSYQLINAPEGGINYTWSSIAKTDKFRQAEMPLPVLVADGRNPGEHLVGGNATVYEFNPWEFGTFDPTIFGFVPLEYLGTRFEDGVLPRGEKCFRGFDNAGYIMGTSSSLFNQFLLNINSTDLADPIKKVLSNILSEVDQEAKDISNYTNPFYHYSKSSSPYAQSRYLAVVDGGEDLQNLPLHPLIQPERHVDVIFAVDSSADTNNWPDGTAMVATYGRSLNAEINNGTRFPSVPDRNTFLNLGLNNRPTFFGCNSNITGTQSAAPLIVYIPNSPYIVHSNVSTFDMSYNNTVRDAIILNGYNVATMGNSTRDPGWSTCVGCAVLSRSMERTHTTVPTACNQCFQRYCWNGTTDSRTPAPYEPELSLAEVSLRNAGGVLRASRGLFLLTFLALF
ncbi:lysophospholipase 1 [Aspergillus udagawae]|uniref:Lysophospholipase n=1 Tax=Aspergillus udagawae TaxID=91492 RepID=A0ABQ1AKJ7_9EURO|nr:lysophospholipase 1 [Aspergillus udagawae]GFF83566.1 lysophospholipase 1 [Aspergillus udagawae]GFG05600.1 lysophospholipase 1 [Aspergillus udagawae]GFG27699.1 lysophospholipase 1 [Aspergillus udagawae]